MPFARSNGIDLCYETFGDPKDPPLLLVMGLGAQMILWDERLCRALTEGGGGRYVIRFDNRDIGLSTKLDALHTPSIMELMPAFLGGKPIDAPYTLDAMADDALGLLDALSIDKAHVVGASMGGMIAQTMALRAPQRLRSLTSIMSTTGDRSLPPPKPEAMMALLSPLSSERGAFIDGVTKVYRTIGSPGFPFNERHFRDYAGRAFDRCYHPVGALRQIMAILASGSRRERLRAVKLPTLVIHGAADPLIPVEGGRDVAAQIEGSELLVFEGMGHDLPEALWPEIVAAVGKLTARS